MLELDEFIYQISIKYKKCQYLNQTLG